jgi:AcrR family transcriptional regulator
LIEDQTGNQEIKEKKEKETKAKILAAAKKIFSEYPYHTASIRMIGTAAGLNYPLVAYYFPSKAALFNAVVTDVCDAYYEAAQNWLYETASMGSTKGLSVYLDRAIEFTQTHPEALRIVLLNLVQTKESKIIPGYQIRQDFFSRATPLFKQTSSARAADLDIENFAHNFNTLIINYLGAKDYYAGVLGLEPDSTEYKNWVKDNMMSLFLPLLQKLIRGDNQS